jgi:hypothetical protein
MKYDYKVEDVVAARDVDEWMEGTVKKISGKIIDVEIVGWAGPLLWLFHENEVLPIEVAKKRGLIIKTQHEGEPVVDTKVVQKMIDETPIIMVVPK